MKIVGVNLEVGGVGWHRCWNWTTAMKRRGHSVKHRPHEAEQFKWNEVDDLLRGTDVVITSKMTNAQVFAGLLAGRKLYGYKLVVDTDDDVDTLEAQTPAFKDYHAGAGTVRIVRAEYKEADLVTASTPYLAEKVRKYNGHVIVVPNCVDPDLYKSVRTRTKEPRHANDIRIYWGGGGGHYPDLLMVKEAVTRVFNEDPRVKLVFSNFVPDWAADLDPFRVFMIPFAQFNAYPKVLRWICADIAIAPMLDTEFNRSKSNIKWLDYTMAHVPGVYSDVESYKSVTHGTTGLKAKTTDEWYDCLKSLVGSRDLGKYIVQNAIEEIGRNYTINTWAPRYESMLLELVGRKARPEITMLNEGIPTVAMNA